MSSCATDQTLGHIVYFTPNVAGADKRLAASGMTFVGRAAGIVTYFRGAGGFYIEVGSPAFQGAELVP